MKRDAYSYRRCANGTVCVMVEMDKEMFEHLLDSYKACRVSNKLGDNIAALNLTKEILQAAEEGCKNEL